MPDTSSTVIQARMQAEHVWNTVTSIRKLSARLGAWTTGRSPDGRHRLTAQVTGPDAARAVTLFASADELVLKYPGDLLPQFDVAVPGRTGLVWRSLGVWVELWHPDTPTSLPTPRPTAPARTVVGEKLGRASARLPFGRRRTTRTP
ncbi:hypothetical protein OIE75_41080 (plasmid) [Streptomyces sp. NBC_01723]|uniref:hypothetical protein n=1 Tax=Streptomyces sp. NBC_01723 TaxID=2975921 RepID=UPI002E35ABAB|nr:hypothetical protein [Streptomyces sp. NBC_01723]